MIHREPESSPDAGAIRWAILAFLATEILLIGGCFVSVAAYNGGHGTPPTTDRLWEMWSEVAMPMALIGLVVAVPVGIITFFLSSAISRRMK
jgi:hypothetical protein